MLYFVRLLQGSAVSRHLDRGGGREGAPPQQSPSCSVLAFDAQCLREKGDQGNCCVGTSGVEIRHPRLVTSAKLCSYKGMSWGHLGEGVQRKNDVEK